MKAREYIIMCEAVERGVLNGIARYNKNRDIPVADDLGLTETIVTYVMQEVGDYFIWEDLNDEA